jgi:phage shock protein A
MSRTLSGFDSGLAAHSNFERMEEKVAEMEARTEAMAELDDGASELEKEFWAMEVDMEVDDELARLKKKMLE